MVRPTDAQVRERTPSGDRELASLAHALAHPVRVQLLRLMLRQGPGCFCGDLVRVIGLAQSTVSHHLKILREANLIVTEGTGVSVCYCANRATLRHFLTLLAGLGPLDDQEEGE